MDELLWEFRVPRAVSDRGSYGAVMASAPTHHVTSLGLTAANCNGVHN